MISHFFIDRPIFASVLSIVFVLAGGVAVFTLPVAQYPDVTPPTVLVTACIPGRTPRPCAIPWPRRSRQQVSGVENMLYMSSQCTNDGAYTLTVTFKLGMDSDMAQVLVQNRVSLALPVIPQLVQNEGINVKKMSPNTMMIVNLISPDGRYDSIFLSNYATIQIKDELGRLPGVAGITYLGQRDYSMRAWLDPDKLAALNLTRQRRRHRHQPAKPAGRGRADRPAAGSPRPAVSTDHQHAGPANRSRPIRVIILKTYQTAEHWRPREPPGTGTRRRPVARPALHAGLAGDAGRHEHLDRSCPSARRSEGELGSQQYDQSCTLDGKPSVALSIYQLPGSNALHTASGVYSKMEELKSRFPDGLDYEIVYDTTPFISESVNEVFQHLRDAIILVAIVVLVVFAKLAGGDHPAHRRAGGHHRHVRRDGGASAFRSTTCRCSDWCWPSASWSTMRSWWSRTSSAGSSRAAPREAAARPWTK